LKLPINRNEAAKRAFLRGARANLLVRYANDAGLAASVRGKLRATAPIEWPDLEQMARLLRMLVSTLRHRLQLEGRSYRSIRDELLRERAIRALNGGWIGVAELAASLGFAEPSAFHRAFRKWRGTTPGAYRRSVARSSPSGKW